MSGDNDIAFVVHYGGRFENLGGVVFYVGGRIHFLEVPSSHLFKGIEEAEIVDLNRQRIWYKLPYEDTKALKVLYDGSPNFSNMCLAASWTKSVEIYLEIDDATNEVEEENRENDAELPVEENRDNVGLEDDRESGCSGANNEEENQGNDGSEEEQGNNQETRNEGENGEQHFNYSRVDEIIDAFVDEVEENEALRNTPPVSDDEDAEDDVAYERWRKGSGELKIMQVFESIKEFKEAVLEYALLGAHNVKYTRWGYDKCEVKCAVKGKKPCDWRIYCSYEESVGLYMVKSYQEEHSCTPDGYCKLLTETVIANLLINEIRNDNALMPKAIQDIIQMRYDLTVTHDICRKARQKALKMVNAEFDEQYARINDYKAQILESNPGSTVDVVTSISEEGIEVFDKFYVCFKALKNIWRGYCRPIFGIDGCFLKSTTRGQLLAAVGRDANNQIYPIAWGIVQVEDTDNWKWFIERLKIDLNLQDGEGFTLISDRQKGLLKAVEEELPKVEHRMCARHIYGNLKRKHPKKALLKKLFWAVADSFNKADYEAALKNLQAYDTEIYDDLKARNPTTCSRAFFSTIPVCEDALNNFSESYNSGLEKARSLPLVEMLETMRRQTMVRIELRKNKLIKYKAMFSLKVARTLAVEDKERKWCKRFPGPNGISEVSEKGVSHTVNMEKQTCTCRRWDVTGIPCRHALKVIVDKKGNPEDYVADCYLASIWKQQYSDSITPVEGLKFWSECGSNLQPPVRDSEKGRKKKPQKRKRSIHESPTKGKKLSKHLRIIHCYRCGMAGHNSTNCSYDGVPNKPRKVYPRKKKGKGAESMVVEYDAGPSQPTQTSVAEE